MATAVKSSESARAKGWLSSGTHPAPPIALGEPQKLLQEQGEADGRDQRLLPPGAAERDEDRARRAVAPPARHGGREREGGRQKRGGR